MQNCKQKMLLRSTSRLSGCEMLLRFDVQLKIVGFILLLGVTNEVSCECGVSTPPVNTGYSGEPKIFPWHVLIYQRSEGSDYLLKCAGTLTEPDTVVSAAHCFYNETGKTIFSPRSFKVAVGKYFTPYTWRERNIQTSEIKEIHLLTGYHGSSGSFSKDIAWIILEKPFNITQFVNPVCTDVYDILETSSLQSGQIGKTAVCQRYRNSIRSAKLKDRNFSVIPRDECMSLMPESRRPYITYDKFCAACSNNETGLSATNSGSGLHFQHNGKWYLRGVLSFINDSDTSHSGTNLLVFSDVRDLSYELNISTDITQCGTTPAIRDMSRYIFSGTKVEHGQYPWHVAIYEMSPSGSYDQICSGSLINPSVVISAAHCFWDESVDAKNNASNYAIAAGKLDRIYNMSERYAQRTGIRDIYMRERYYGASALHAEDIACLILESPMHITDFVRPVCLDLNNEHEMDDLRVGQIGRIPSWDLAPHYRSSSGLTQLNLPYIEYNQCRSTAPRDFSPFITFDKFCAGYTNGTSLCNGDGGSGLVFQHEGQWYLRGIASVSPHKYGMCDKNHYTGFTNVGTYAEDLRRFANLNFTEIIQ